MLFSVEQAFVGRDEKRALLKTPAWEATINPDKSSPPPHPLFPGDTPLFGQNEYVNGVWFWGSQEYNFSI